MEKKKRQDPGVPEILPSGRLVRRAGGMIELGDWRAVAIVEAGSSKRSVYWTYI